MANENSSVTLFLLTTLWLRHIYLSITPVKIQDEPSIVDDRGLLSIRYTLFVLNI